MRPRMLCGLFMTALFAGAGVAAGQPTPAAPIRVVVDQRIELLCIVFRLAGNPEYSYAEVASYAKDVDGHFEKYKNHPVVVRARRLHETRGLSFGDPMAMAVNLTGLPELGERVPFDPFPPEPASRWASDDARAFLADLRAFAREADVAGFLAAHNALYRTSVERLQATLRESGVAEWLDPFFGRRDDDRLLVIAISLLNASGSFGLSLRTVEPAAATPRTSAASAVEEFMVVLGAGYTDAVGAPAFPSHQASTIVHEFSHSYIRRILTGHMAQFEAPAAKIFPLVETDMRRQAYGSPDAIIHEGLVRACTVRYAWDHGGAEAGRRQAAAERARGFLWVPKLAELLGDYERERATYPTFDDFVPRVAAFFEDYSRTAAADVATLQAERQAKMASPATSPRVASTSPANDADNVEAAGVTSIAITFDRAMRDSALAVVMVPGLAFPKVKGRPAFDASHRVLTIPCELQPGTAYGMSLNSKENMVMTDEQGNLLAPVLYRFTTRK